MFGLKMGELLIVGLVLLVIVPVIVVGPILFLVTWGRTLRLTRAHQRMEPGFVWLMLIPVFNLGWQFFLLRAATRGIQGRLAELGSDAGDGGFKIGVAYQSLVCLATLLSAGLENEQVSLVVGFLLLASVITWILYWVRISRFNQVMEDSSSPPRPAPLAG